MKKARTLCELFSFPGFITKHQLEGQFGDPKARTIILKRKKKPQHVQHAVVVIQVITIEKLVTHVIAMLKVIVFIFALKSAEYIARSVIVYAWKH